MIKDMLDIVFGLIKRLAIVILFIVMIILVVSMIAPGAVIAILVLIAKTVFSFIDKIKETL